MTGIVLCLGASLEASSIAFRLGRFAPNPEGELWRDNADTFELELADLNSISGGVEFALELNEFLDFTVGVDGYSRTVFTRYRDFVRDDGSEIEQELRLSVAPVTAGMRFLPAGKFRALIPYVAGGVGLYPYEYREEGEFIDFQTFDIFGGTFIDRGLGTGLYAAFGLEVPVARRLTVFGEFRRHWVWAQHKEDFSDFGDFRLNLRQIQFGVNLRF
jgi:hypothetical protein